MSLSFGLSPWLLLPAALLAAGLAAWLYRSTVPELPRGKRILMGALRFGALFLILLLLLEPIVRIIDRDEEAPVLAVLVDNSRSLLLTAGEDSSSGVLKSRFDAALRSLPESIRDAEIRFYAFDGDLTELQNRAPIDSLTFNGARTNIATALEGTRELLRDEHFAAALLISDGQYNTGRNPLYEAERFPVPIYTAVVGDTTRHRDVQIRRVTTNEIAYTEAELPIQVGVRTEDMGGEEVVVSIVEDGQVRDSQSTRLPDGSTEINIDLSVTPDEEGLHRFTAIVTRVDGEVTFQNNQETFSVRVLSTRRKIALIGGAPDPDVSSIIQLLQDDPTFELETFVQKGPGTFYEGAFPQDLTQYDLIVLAGYPGPAATDDVSARIAGAATDGTPIFFLLTRNSDPSRLQQAFGDLLPVSPERTRPGYVEAQFALTAAGASHPILSIPSSSAELWLRLPPLLYRQTRWQTSPDADVLARSIVRGVELDDPLFVVRRRSTGRTAALLGAGTWRWRNVPEDLSQAEHLWPSLFSNAVQWLTAREDDRPVRVEPTRDVFGGGENVSFTGQVYDESLNPVEDASIEIRVSAPDGTVSPYVMNSIGNGRYALNAGTFPEGTYRYEAVARHDGRTLGNDAGSFAVGSLTLEFKETRANPQLMRQIAERSGGDFIETGPSEALGSRIAAAESFAPVIIERESEVELRRRYIFLAIIIGLLTVEWFIRKRSGMV